MREPKKPHHDDAPEQTADIQNSESLSWVGIRDITRHLTEEIRVLVPADGAIQRIAFEGAVYLPRFIFTVAGTYGGPMLEVRFRTCLSGDPLPTLPPGVRAELVGTFDRRFLGFRLDSVHLFREIPAPRAATDTEIAEALGKEPDARKVLEVIATLDARNAGALALLVDDRRAKVAAAARARLAAVRRQPTSKKARASRGRRA